MWHGEKVVFAWREKWWWHSPLLPSRLEPGWLAVKFAWETTLCGRQPSWLASVLLIQYPRVCSILRLALDTQQVFGGGKVLNINREWGQDSKWSQLPWLCWHTLWFGWSPFPPWTEASPRDSFRHDWQLGWAPPTCPFVPLSTFSPDPFSFCHLFCDRLFLPASIWEERKLSCTIFSYGQSPTITRFKDSPVYV